MYEMISPVSIVIFVWIVSYTLYDFLKAIYPQN